MTVGNIKFEVRLESSIGQRLFEVAQHPDAHTRLVDIMGTSFLIVEWCLDRFTSPEAPDMISLALQEVLFVKYAEPVREINQTLHIEDKT